MLKKTYKCPFTTKTDKVTDKKLTLTPGQIYKLRNGATIKFLRANDKASEESIGTVQQYNIRFTAIRISNETAGPHPHADQDIGHPQRTRP